MGTVGRELIKEQKKIIIKLGNSNSMQFFISNTLNVKPSCIRKFPNCWKCQQSVEKWLQTGRPVNLMEGAIRE